MVVEIVPIVSRWCWIITVYYIVTVLEKNNYTFITFRHNSPFLAFIWIHGYVPVLSGDNKKQILIMWYSDVIGYLRSFKNHFDKHFCKTGMVVILLVCLFVFNRWTFIKHNLVIGWNKCICNRIWKDNVSRVWSLPRLLGANVKMYCFELRTVSLLMSFPFGNF